MLKLLAERNTWLPELAQLRTDAELLSTFDVDDIPTEALIAPPVVVGLEVKTLSF